MWITLPAPPPKAFWNAITGWRFYAGVTKVQQRYFLEIWVWSKNLDRAQKFFLKHYDQIKEQPASNIVPHLVTLTSFHNSVDYTILERFSTGQSNQTFCEFLAALDEELTYSGSDRVTFW